MNRARLRFVLCCLGIAMASGGCGYHVAGHNDALPKSIHVIAVPALENKTSTYRVEQKLTAATIHEFLVRTPYRIVSDPDGGDAVLRGKVLSVEVVPLTFETRNPIAGSTTQVAQATSMLVIVKCEVTLTERSTEKVLYHTDNFVFRNEYELASVAPSNTQPASVRSFFQEGDPALDRLAQEFASRLVAAVTENF